MRNIFVLIMLSWPLVLAQAQVGITGLSSNGILSWSNCLAASLLGNPIYSVEWANSPTSTWQTAALVTNTQSFELGELLRSGRPETFIRIGWLNATSASPVGVYKVKAHDEPAGVTYTGRVELTSVDANGVHGTWELQPTPWSGHTNGFAQGTVAPALVNLHLGSLFDAEGPYLLGGKYFGNGFTGRWFNCGIICVPAGHYTARRICP